MTVAPDRRPLEFDSIDDVVEALRESGHRVTAPARAVLDALFAADAPVSVEQIASGVRFAHFPMDGRCADCARER
jgi:Fe2+ or Zn2+ uptake regulation protein